MLMKNKDSLDNKTLGINLMLCCLSSAKTVRKHLLKQMLLVLNMWLGNFSL